MVSSYGLQSILLSQDFIIKAAASFLQNIRNVQVVYGLDMFVEIIAYRL